MAISRRVMILRICLIIVWFLVVQTATVTTVSAVDLADIVDNPLGHGAWLYKTNCTRCHGPYEKEHPGESYSTEESLADALAKGGCRVSWGHNGDKTLNQEELAAVSHYIRTWEKLGQEPDLPDLPALAPPKAQAPAIIETLQTKPTPIPVRNEELSPALRKLIEAKPIAKGAWLYTRNCYRCHLSYERSRQARNISLEALKKIIENGKTSTQMTGFGLLAGGKLKSSEIDAIAGYITVFESFDGSPAIAAELLKPPAIEPTDLQPIGLPRFPPVDGNVKEGRRLFMEHCSRCHNSDRSGYIGRRLLPPWNSMRPDLFLKSTLKRGIPGSLMQGFTENAEIILGSKQIDDLVAFLLGQ